MLQVSLQSRHMLTAINAPGFILELTATIAPQSAIAMVINNVAPHVDAPGSTVRTIGGKGPDHPIQSSFNASSPGGPVPVLDQQVHEETSGSTHLLMSAETGMKVAAAASTVQKPKLFGASDVTENLGGPSDKLGLMNSSIQAGFPTLKVTLEGFMKIGNLLANIHPIVAAAWSIVDVAYKVIQANNNLYTNVQDLISAMENACMLAKDYAPREHQGKCSTDKVVQKILCEVVHGSQIVIAYGDMQKKSGSVLHAYFSDLDAQMQACVVQLSSLRIQLSEHANGLILTDVVLIGEKIEYLSKKVEHLNQSSKIC
ncbi:hypothetical protein DL93DRAFT_1318351 [Clavulina sp. PMI_390]|nr:hypothetical protein DL93DRAFT_1318351 [Clavulina sp. PMI_390]